MKATLPSPSDYDLSWGDILLLVNHTNNHRQRQKILIQKFYIAETVANAWLDGAKRFGGES